jgi:hypothetical protein
LLVEGYEIKAIKLRENSRGGGTIIFGKNKIKTVKIDSPFIEGCIEMTCIKIDEVIILNVYRQPSGDKNLFKEVVTQFIDSLRSDKILIAGDFNINMIREDRIIKEICNLYHLEAKISSVTRIASGTCIDNFITNCAGEFVVSEIAIANHQALIATIKCRNLTKLPKQKFKYRQMKEINWLTFKHHLHNITIHGNDIE